MADLADKVCSQCGKEYYLEHFKMPFKDDGETLHCDCGNIIFSYGKGTDMYSLISVADYEERRRRREEEKERKKEEEKNYPICKCGLKMVPRSGPYGDFFGCRNYPNGCNKIVKKKTEHLK